MVRPHIVLSGRAYPKSAGVVLEGFFIQLMLFRIFKRIAQMMCRGQHLCCFKNHFVAVLIAVGDSGFLWVFIKKKYIHGFPFLREIPGVL
jgi:hypothetical protein